MPVVIVARVDVYRDVNLLLNQEMILPRPSSRVMLGDQPRICLAFVMSGHLLFGSSGGNGLWMIFEELPESFLTFSAKVMTVIWFGLPVGKY